MPLPLQETVPMPLLHGTSPFEKGGLRGIFDGEIPPAPLLQRGVNKDSLKSADECATEHFSESDKVSSSAHPFDKGGLGGGPPSKPNWEKHND
jgi:hypothetical protein